MTFLIAITIIENKTIQKTDATNLTHLTLAWMKIFKIKTNE